MGIENNRLTNANIYADGGNLLGRAEEVDSPKLVAVMSEQKTLGMLGKREYPTGFDKMEMRIKWNAIYPDVIGKFGNMYKSIKIMIRASLETWTGGDRVGQVPVVIYATVQSKGLPLPNFKPNDNSEQESNLSCTYVKMEIDGVNKLEFDAEANIYRVDGVDLMKEYRDNIGQ
jgi:P2 family phage contractile tail tube protein